MEGACKGKKIHHTATLKLFLLFICSSMKEEAKFFTERRRGAEIGLEKVT